MTTPGPLWCLECGKPFIAPDQPTPTPTDVDACDCPYSVAQPVSVIEYRAARERIRRQYARGPQLDGTPPPVFGHIQAPH